MAELVLVRPMPRPIPTKAVLVCRLFALELIPFVGALAYSYFHPRMLLIALSLYSVCALANALLSVRDGAALEIPGIVWERATDGFQYWLWVIRPALFPLAILCIAIPPAIITGTLFQ